jgi:CheY-like chemotaxis protein
MRLRIPLDQLARLREEVRLLAEMASDHQRQVEALATSAELGVRRRSAGLADHASCVDDLQRWTENRDAANRLAVSVRRQHGTAVRLLSYLGGHATSAGRSHRPVLIVDDSDEIRQCVTEMLEHAGYKVGTAGNGLEGLLAAHEMRPCVILMDLAMPLLDGIEASRLIKAMKSARAASIIAHTGTPEGGKGRDAGLFDAVLEKPASAETLVATVGRFARA